jgi:hypothetical protein
MRQKTSLFILLYASINFLLQTVRQADTVDEKRGGFIARGQCKPEDTVHRGMRKHRDQVAVSKHKYVVQRQTGRFDIAVKLGRREVDIGKREEE